MTVSKRREGKVVGIGEWSALTRPFMKCSRAMNGMRALVTETCTAVLTSPATRELLVGTVSPFPGVFR